MPEVSAPLRLMIDTDAGSDDAVALVLAAREPGVDIEAVTVVAGNVPLQQAVRNALYTLEVLGRSDVPVHRGRDAPLQRRLDTAQQVHGVDGMGDLGLPDPTMSAQSGDAVDALLQRSRSAPGELTLVTLGPLTNIAAALQRDPDALSRFKHVFLMAGAADGIGNVAPVAEFNVWADPEAAHAVVASGATNLTFIGWDVSRRYAVMRPEEQARLAALATPVAGFMNGINRCVNEWALSSTGLPGYDLPDPVAMAVALRPELATHITEAHLAVSVHEPTRGMLLVDRRHRPLAPNAAVVWSVDEAGFKDMIFDAAAQPTIPGIQLPSTLQDTTGATA